MKIFKSNLKYILILSTLLTSYLLLLTLNNNSVYAAKKRIKVKAVSGYSSAKLRTDRKAVLLTLYNINSVKQITYTLSYTGSDVEQGVQGTVSPGGANSTTRELLFGTCSKNVCRYHTGLQNMKLTVVTSLRSGKTHTKIYRVKP